jgi:hypothetical protein
MMLEQPDLHPSYFQDDLKNIKDNMQNQRTLLSVKEERERTLAVDDLKKLQSPGKYNFTVDDKSLKGSNTNSMFKNLYGETLLTFLFFSDKNVENIQRLIRMTVFRHTKQVIDNQSNTELLVVMRSIFLAFSQHPKLLDESIKEKERKLLLAQYTDEVDRLNQLVIDTCVPLIVSQLQQYLVYLYDSSSPLRVMEKPLSTSVKGTKSYRSQTQVLVGGDL